MLPSSHRCGLHRRAMRAACCCSRRRLKRCDSRRHVTSPVRILCQLCADPRFQNETPSLLSVRLRGLRATAAALSAAPLCERPDIARPRRIAGAEHLTEKPAACSLLTPTSSSYRTSGTRRITTDGVSRTLVSDRSPRKLLLFSMTR